MHVAPTYGRHEPTAKKKWLSNCFLAVIMGKLVTLSAEWVILFPAFCHWQYIPWKVGMRLVISDSAYELTAAHNYHRQHELHCCKEWRLSKPKWLKILMQRYLLVSEICTFLHIQLHVYSKCTHACLVGEKVVGPKPDQPDCLLGIQKVNTQGTVITVILHWSILSLHTKQWIVLTLSFECSGLQSSDRDWRCM